MAQFNSKPPTTEQAQNFLGYSQGAVAPKARQAAFDSSAGVDNLGGLIRGIGDSFNLAITAKDQSTQRAIEADVTELTDAARGEFGVDAATVLAENSAITQTPSEITRQAEHLDSLSQAVRSGKLKDSHYWARVNNIARQLRYKYPGYRQQIDEMTSRAVGSNPANALRSSLQSEREAEARTTTGLTDVEKFVNANIKGDVLPPSYFSNPQDYDLFRLQKETFERARVRAVRDERQADLAYRKAQGEAVDTEIGTLANTHVATVVKEATDPLLSQYGKNWDELKNKILEAQNSGTPLSAEETNGIRQQFGVFKTIVSEQVELALADYPTLDPAEKKKIKETQLSRLNAMEDAITNKNFGVLLDNVARTELDLNERYTDLMGIQDIANQQAISKALGPEASRSYYSDPENLSKVNFALRNAQQDKVLSGKSSLKEVVEDSKNRGVKDPAFYSSLISNVAKMASDPNIPLKEFANNAKALYGPKNQGFLSQLKKSERPTKFLQLSNPAVAKRMFALRDTEPELWDSYKSWTLDSAATLGQTIADSVKEIRVNRKYLDVSFDEKSKQFALEETPDGTKARLNPNQQFLVDAGEFFLESKATAQTAINDMNKYVAAVNSVFSVEGDDGTKLKNYISRSMGFSNDLPKEGPTIEQLFTSVNKAVAVGEPGKQFPSPDKLGATGLPGIQATNIKSPNGMEARLVTDSDGTSTIVYRVPPGVIPDKSISGRTQGPAGRQRTDSEGFFIEAEELTAMREEALDNLTKATTTEDLKEYGKQYLDLVKASAEAESLAIQSGVIGQLSEIAQNVSGEPLKKNKESSLDRPFDQDVLQKIFGGPSRK